MKHSKCHMMFDYFKQHIPEMSTPTDSLNRYCSSSHKKASDARRQFLKHTHEALRRRMYHRKYEDEIEIIAARGG